MPQTRFGLLGPLLVEDGSGAREVAAPRQRALLAALLLNANKPVSAGDLAEQVWNTAPPAGAAGTLHSYLSRLRSALGPECGQRIKTRSGGYLVGVDEDELDLAVFAGHRATARAAAAAGEFETAAAAYSAALGMWRGAPLADVPEGPWREDAVRFWTEQRLLTREEQLDVDLRLGRQSAAVPVLQSLVREHPFREKLAGLLLTALTLDGRKAEALTEFRRIRRMMIDEAGVEPGGDLTALHERILRDQPLVEPAKRPEGNAAEKDAASTAPGHTAASPPVPQQLPPPVSDFTGRDAELGRLADVLTGRPPGSSPAIAVITGPGGLGKTSFAVQLGHRLRAAFPDGQLYVHLGSLRAPRRPAEVGTELLRSLGVAAPEIPADLDQRAALLRSVLADRRVLLVLDDAADSGQIRPLLPGSAPSAVVVTSRRRLPGLADQTPVELDSLSPTDSAAMLARIIGAERAAAEPEALADLVEACGGFPIALRICGARLAMRRTRSIESLAARLRTLGRRLDELVAEDVAVRSTLDESYRSLLGAEENTPSRPAAARAFRLLSLLGGERFSLPAAAALLDTGEDAVDAALEHLVEVSLLDVPAVDRFGFHPLIRELAREHAEATDSPAERAAALSRWTSWCLGSSAALDRLLNPNRPRIAWESWVQPADPPPFRTPEAAIAWFDLESAGLLEAVQVAAALGDHATAVALPLFLIHAFRIRGRVEEIEEPLLTSANCAAALGEPEVRGVIANHLAIVYGALRRFDEAAATFASAIPFFEAAGRPERVAQIRVNSAITVAQSGDPVSAAKLLQEARHTLDELELQTGPSPITANLRPTALLALAEALGETGRYDEAREVFPELLASAEAAGNTALLAIAWSNLGKIEHRGGRSKEAFACLDKALALHRAAGNRDGEGFGLWALGEVRKSVGDVEGARREWEQARVLFEVLGQAGYVKDLTAAIAALGDQPPGDTGTEAARP